MARARNIKPGFFTNDVLGECEPLARILFQGLWCHADREGRLEDRPRKLKAEILPYDNCDVETLLSQLEQRGFVIRYQHGTGRFIQVVNFVKHQNPHIKEQESTIPAPCLHDASHVVEQVEHGSCRADSLNLIPDSPIPITDSSKKPAQKRRQEYDEEFIAAWSAYPRRPGANKAQTFKAWSSRIDEGVSPSAMIEGAIRYANYCRASGTSPEYIKQPATFFGPHRHFDSDWFVEHSSATRKSQHQIVQEAQTKAIFGDTGFLIGEKVVTGEVVQ